MVANNAFSSVSELKMNTFRVHQYMKYIHRNTVHIHAHSAQPYTLTVHNHTHSQCTTIHRHSAQQFTDIHTTIHRHTHNNHSKTVHNSTIHTSTQADIQMTQQTVTYNQYKLSSFYINTYELYTSISYFS